MKVLKNQKTLDKLINKADVVDGTKMSSLEQLHSLLEELGIEHSYNKCKYK